MKKIIGLIIILLLSCGCESKNTDYTTNDDSINKTTLEEIQQKKIIDKAKEIADEAVERLIQTGQFENIVFESVEKRHVDEDDICVKYTIFDTDLYIYIENEEITKMELNQPNFSEKKKNQNLLNQKLAILYLKEFDISENSFDNSNENYSYETFLKVISGIKNGIVVASNNPNYIYYISNYYSAYEEFSIWKYEKANSAE